jgi:hypothetical protein
MTAFILATGAALTELKVNLQEIIDLVAYGLSVEPPSRRTTRNIIPEAPFQVNPHPTWALEPAKAKVRFHSWIIGNGLRELIDTATVKFLEAAFLDCETLLFLRERGVEELEGRELEEFNSRLTAARTKFRKSPMIQKLRHLKKEYGLNWDSTMEECILSIQRARNCFTHNQGLVTTTDFSRSAGEVGLSVMFVVVNITREAGGAPSLIKTLEDIGSGGVYLFGSNLLKKVFGAGARLVFSPKEFTEIALTLFIFSQVVAEQLFVRASDLGYNLSDDAQEEWKRLREIYLCLNAEGKTVDQAIPVEWRDGRLRFPPRLFKNSPFGDLE